MTSYTQQLENYWHNYSTFLAGAGLEQDAKRKERNLQIAYVLEEQFNRMDEETQGAFGMALSVSEDEDEAEGLPLTIAQLESVKKCVLDETERLLKAKQLISE